MTNEERKVIELALEALETPWNAPYVDGCDLALGKRVKAITAIKEALAQPDQDEVDIRSRLYQRIHELETQLAQPEQEPVKMVAYNCTCGRTMKFESVHGVVAPQRTWVGLTDKEMYKLWLTVDEEADRMAFGKAVEAKLKEKNT